MHSTAAPPDVFSDLGGQFPWSSKLFDTGGGVRQALVDEGPRDARFTFLCLHGNPTWGFLYRDFVRALAGEHRVLVPDHVGFGRSDKPADLGYYTLERHIANLTRTMAAARPRNVILVVQDWGGPIGMGWATRHSELIAGVVVLNTWAFVRAPVMKLPWWFKLAVRGPSGYRRVTEKNFFVETILGRLGTVRRLSRPVLDAYRAPHRSATERVGIAAFPRMIPETHDQNHRDWPTMAEIEDRLPSLASRPAVVIWGTKDPAFGQAQLNRWRSVFPTARGPFLLRASHYLQEDAPTEILGHVQGWLRDVAPRP
jgi:haloalkane dehalogenase